MTGKLPNAHHGLSPPLSAEGQINHQICGHLIIYLQVLPIQRCSGFKTEKEWQAEESPEARDKCGWLVPKAEWPNSFVRRD